MLLSLNHTSGIGAFTTKSSAPLASNYLWSDEPTIGSGGRSAQQTFPICLRLIYYNKF
jgi:hypothetical protein